MEFWQTFRAKLVLSFAGFLCLGCCALAPLQVCSSVFQTVQTFHAFLEYSNRSRHSCLVIVLFRAILPLHLELFSRFQRCLVTGRFHVRAVNTVSSYASPRPSIFRCHSLDPLSSQPSEPIRTRTNMADQTETGGSRLGFGVSLTTGHHAKKKMNTTQDETAGFLNISAYGVAQCIDLQSLRSHLIRLSGYHCLSLPADLAAETLLISSSLHTPRRETQRDAFIFRNGVLVLWNMTEAEHRMFISHAKLSARDVLPDSLVEREVLRYRFTDGQTRLVGEDIFLQTQQLHSSTESIHLVKPEELVTTSRSSGTTLESLTLSHARNHLTDTECSHPVPINDPVRMQQFAFSDALSLSVKLSLLESSFDSVAVQMEPWIERLKNGRWINLPQSAVLRRTGEIFTLKHLLNISTSMLDTPDLYWERPEAEALYTQLRSALNVNPRIRILNSRLNMCCELTEILSSLLQSRHGARLEWMIILLICVEICFEAYYYYERRLDRLTSAFEVNTH